MGQPLVNWVDSQPRKTRDYPRGLTRTERAVYREMCRVTAEDRCLFYMHLDDLLERLPDIATTSALRNHIYALADKGYICHVSVNDKRAQRGGGHSSHFVYHPDGTRLGRRSVTHWLILADGITPEFPRQGRLPLLTLYRSTPTPAIQDEWIRTHPGFEEPENRTRPTVDQSESVRKSDTSGAGQDQELSENLARPSREVSENRTRVAVDRADSVWKSDTSGAGQKHEVSENLARPRGEVSENRTLPHVLGGYKNRIHESMHASMLEDWTESFIGQCARRSGLTGLRPLHLQHKQRGRDGPIPSVYDSVSAYIEREGRAPPDETAGWLADELHYTLLHDPSWQDGGHSSAPRLIAFIAAVVARHLEREEIGGLYFDPGKGAPETSGHRYQPSDSPSRTQPVRRSL